MAFDIEHHLAVFRRGADELLVESELAAKLQRGHPLRIKEGFDPTRPDLHLGHTVQFNKLRQLQDLGRIYPAGREARHAERSRFGRKLPLV